MLSPFQWCYSSSVQLFAILCLHHGTVTFLSYIAIPNQILCFPCQTIVNAVDSVNSSVH